MDNTEVLKLSVHQPHLEGLLKYGFLVPTLRVSDYVVLGKGPRIWISKKFSVDADAEGLGTTL